MRRGIIVCGLVLGLMIVWARGAGHVWAFDSDSPDLYGPGEAWVPPADLGPGDQGAFVQRLQRALATAGFRPGTTDGSYGAGTRAAVIAFQKAHDLPRDGVFRASDWDLLTEPVDLGLAIPPDRVEIDLRRQVLYLVDDNEVRLVLPISSGSGNTYRGHGGSVSRARTPEGAFSFYRHVPGWRISYLGGLYEPYYFYGGYAIHGSGSVPPYPASHGCVRVRIPDMDYLKALVHVGMPIYVYGDRVERTEIVPTPRDPDSTYRRLRAVLPASLGLA